MAQKPFSEMADIGYENMSEESGYILHEIKLQMRGLTSRIESASTKSELQSVWKSAENLFASKNDVSTLSKNVETLLELDIPSLAKYVAKMSEDHGALADLLKSVNSLAKDQDNHKTYIQDVEISSAELLALNATPKLLVADPGANKYVDVLHVQFCLDYATTPYVVGAGSDFSLQNNDGSEFAQLETTGFLDQSSEQRRFYHHPAALQSLVVGSGVRLQILNSELTGGDSALKVRIEYRIVEAI